MIKFDNDEFLKPQIYSTNDEYETRCNVAKEIVDDIKQLQQENQKYKEVIDKVKELIIELSDNTDDIICYEIDKYCKNDLLDILKEV